MAVTINAYNLAIEYMGDNSIDLDGDTFKCELHSALSFNAAHTQRSDISGSAVATGNGYTNPGQNLTSVTWGFSTDKTIFNAGNVSWAASGGSISGDDAVIYDDTHANDLLMFDIDFGATESAGDGTNFVIDFNDTNGIFYIA